MAESLRYEMNGMVACMMHHPTGMRHYTVVPIQAGHVSGLVEAHKTCFEGYFLTSLGTDFLHLYYKNYLDSDYGFGVVAVDEQSEVVAFAVGVTELDSLDALLVRRHLPKVAWILATRWLQDAGVRANVAQRMPRFGRIVQRVTSTLRTGKQSANTVPVQPFVTLASIGVVPGHRGSGVVYELLGEFENEVLKRNYREIRASTSISNSRAVAFYNKSGWKAQSVVEELDGITFQKSLS